MYICIDLSKLVNLKPSQFFGSRPVIFHMSFGIKGEIHCFCTGTELLLSQKSPSFKQPATAP